MEPERPRVTVSLDREFDPDRPVLIKLPRVGALASVELTRDEARRHIAECIEAVRQLDATR